MFIGRSVHAATKQKLELRSVRESAHLVFVLVFLGVDAGILLPGGSPVAAVATSPPWAAAMCASNFPLTADFGFAKVISSVDAY